MKDIIREQPAAQARAMEGERPATTGGAEPASATLTGVCLVMFLVFIGAASSQFHSYLFERRGFGEVELGILLSAGYAAGILSPLMQVRFIRILGGARATLLAALTVSMAALSAVPFVTSFRTLLLAYFLYSFSASAIFPLNTACTLDAVRSRGHGIFFWIRSLGTMGFLSACLVSSRFTDFSDLPFLYLGFAASYLLAMVVIARDYPGNAPGRPVAPRLTLAAAFSKLAKGRTGRLLLVMGVMNFANGLAICMQGNYLTHRWEGGQASISQAWVTSTACELPLFLLCAWVLRRHGLRHVLAMGLAGTLVKLVGLALAAELWQYLLALAMHGFFFSAAITGFNVYLDRGHAREELPSLQALATIFYQGIPNALAGLVAGFIWHAYSLRAVYLAAAGIAFLISLYGVFLLARPLAPRETPA